MKAYKDLWKMYPGSHLHFNVTQSDQQSFRVEAFLLDRENELIASIDHYGSGDLNKLKEYAFEILAEELYESVAA